MRKPTDKEVKSACDFWDVSQAASYLVSQACTLSGRHIKDGGLRASFNREVAYYARGIVRDVENGRKTPDEGMKALLSEKRTLIKQAADIAQKGIGIVAGTMQMRLGAQICMGSGGLLCPFLGAPLLAHGANNVYENGSNLAKGRSDANGPLRGIYQKAAVALGGTKQDGDVAFGTADLALSVFSMNTLVVGRGAWKLFRYVRADYVKAYSQMGVGALGFEAVANTITLKSMIEAYQSNER